MSFVEDIISFWFEEISHDHWWSRDREFDGLLARRFGAVHDAARRCELYSFRTSPQGRLAEILVLDQFSRNMFRGTAQAFAYDPLALCLSQEAIAAGAHHSFSGDKKAFLYMPFMHSEAAAIQRRSVELFAEADLKDEYLQYALDHQKIVADFGRFPHRNEAIGRSSSDAESSFMRTHSGF